MKRPNWLASAPQLADFDKLFVTGCEDLDEVILVRRYSLDATNSWGNWYNQSIGGYCVTTPVKALADAFEYVGERNETMPYLNKDPRFYQTIYAPGMEMRGKYFNTIPNNVVEKDGKTYFDPNKDYGALQDKEVSVGDVLAEGGGGEWNKTPTRPVLEKILSGRRNMDNLQLVYNFPLCGSLSVEGGSVGGNRRKYGRSQVPDKSDS